MHGNAKGPQAELVEKLPVMGGFHASPIAD
jgi:hypothetical protein